MILGWLIKGREITADELHRRLSRGEKFLILDVRHAEEFEGPDGRIPGAVRVPVKELRGRGRELAVASESEVVVVCRVGLASLAALAYLRGLGRPVRSLRGGMRAWRRRGFELIHDTTVRDTTVRDTTVRPGLAPVRKEC